MPAYNKSTPVRSRGRSPVKSDYVPTGATFEGHPGYGRDPKSELFLLGSTQFMKQDAFYEKAKQRDDRFVNLVHQVAVADPVWMLHFVTWLRDKANIRSAALVAGLEAAKGILNSKDPVTDIYVNGQGIVRQLAKAGIRRADEPGEALAYWMSKYGGDPGGGIKRAIADKATELYNERNLLKFDTESHGFRFGDVIELTHPKPKAPWQSDLFRYAIERRHNRPLTDVVSGLGMVSLNMAMRASAAIEPQALLDPNSLRAAGMTWEDVLSLAGSKLDKKLLWESLIPTMGYMALLRNLRNFDWVNVSNEVAEHVARILSDPAQVAKSRQLPFRFLSAFQEAPSLRWAWALEQALEHSLNSAPHLHGSTLILVDTSGSMNNTFSGNSKVKRWDVASLFGIALGSRCDRVTIVSFSGNGYYQQRPSTLYPYREFDLRQGESWLLAWKRWQTDGFNLNGGTDTARAIRENRKGTHTRVVIITDEQAVGSAFTTPGTYRSHHFKSYMTQVNDMVPTSVPLHIINVAGYEKGMIPSGHDNRHVYAGLGDHVFTLMPLVEAGGTGQWPWEQQS